MAAIEEAPNRPTAHLPVALDQAVLVKSLCKPGVFGPDIERVTVIETHISYVLLTGPYAYKIKKAVDLQFLDFTTLDARRFYCDEELRLNRPFAPSIYLDVVAITGTVQAPAIGGDGPVLEYAVKMRQFPQNALLSAVLAHGLLTETHIDALAAAVASFHSGTHQAAASQPYGDPDDVLEPALQNFEQLLTVTDDPRDRCDLESLRAWTVHEHIACAPAFLARRRGGFIRECHGDLHLGNIALIDGHVTLFDRIEFNESMRWIDVMSDVAFVVMDLQERKRPDLAARFLTAYLETTGDYQGLDVLRFYLVYRAMVRAKVARLRVRQVRSPDEHETLAAEYHKYINLARCSSQRAPAAIIITHGLAGSGKTTCSQWLLERLGAVRIRTDVERKRLHGVEIAEDSDSPVGQGLYTAEATRQTYARVCELARRAAADSYLVIVDGAFLQRWQRDLFRETAAALSVSFVILAVSAPEATLRERIIQRGLCGHDPSEATIEVLEHQLGTQERLSAEEQRSVVSWDNYGGT
jgi:aminoglycoside phosphotransferase family enzyme/predicted kinase